MLGGLCFLIFLAYKIYSLSFIRMLTPQVKSDQSDKSGIATTFQLSTFNFQL